MYFQLKKYISNGQKKVTYGVDGSKNVEPKKGWKTITELASEHGVHGNQISIWENQLLDADLAA